MVAYMNHYEICIHREKENLSTFYVIFNLCPYLKQTIDSPEGITSQNMHLGKDQNSQRTAGI